MQNIKQWINYIWAVIKPYVKYTRNRTYWSFENKLYKLKQKIDNKSEIDINHILSQLNSYMWFFKYTKYKKRFVIIYNKYYKYINFYFYLDINRMCFVLRE